MKTYSCASKQGYWPWTVLVLAGTLAPGHVRGGIFENHTFETFDGVASVPVPDGSPVGISDVRTLESGIGRITSISVSFQTSGDYNGDVYAYLRHGGGFAVLVNRPGVTSTDTYGAADSGFDVTFSDAASNGDIHDYPSVEIPEFGVSLTGTWAPDGRRVDPGIVLDTTPRTAMLAEFVDLDANGTWTLFVADMSSGGEIALESWGLSIEGEAGGAVPEPEAWACWAAVGMLGYAFLGRRVRARW